MRKKYIYPLFLTHQTFSLIFFVVSVYFITFVSEMSNIRTYKANHTIQMISVLLHSDTTDYLLGGSLAMRNEEIDQ